MVGQRDGQTWRMTDGQEIDRHGWTDMEDDRWTDMVGQIWIDRHNGTEGWTDMDR